MKGLLLKDFYTAAKYCRAFVLIMLAFLAVSCFGSDSIIFIVYPIIFSGMIPTTLISYDEREKWNITCETLPYSRAQFVSSKYLIGLILEAAVLILSAAAQGIRMSNAGTFNASEFFSLLTVLFGLGIVAPAVILPLIFRLGVEKGRIAYYIVIGFLCAATTGMMGRGGQSPDIAAFIRVAPVIVIAAAALYALSWGISIAIYKKREL